LRACFAYPANEVCPVLKFEIYVLTVENKKANQVMIGTASIGKKQDFAVFSGLHTI
jgi:hypothetical protein